MVRSGTANIQPTRKWSSTDNPEGSTSLHAGATQNTVPTVAKKHTRLTRGSNRTGSAAAGAAAVWGVSLMLQRFAQLLCQTLQLRAQVGIEHPDVGHDFQVAARPRLEGHDADGVCMGRQR